MLTIYICDVSRWTDAALFEKDYRTMPEDRRQKIDRLRFDKDRRLSLGAGYTLARALADAGLTYEAGAIAAGEHGKPYFPALADRFRFSLSHAGTLAVCVADVSPNGGAAAVGCDVERQTAADLKLAKRFFAAEEYEMLAAFPEGAARDDAFLRLWTLKESFLKVTGMGLSLPLDDFSFTFTPDGVRLRTALPGSFHFGETVPLPGYRLAWCYTGEAARSARMLRI